MEVGLYGKLPTHGDFLRRRVADDFVAAWDDWLQRCIAESRAALGESWLETYLTSPVWRFSLAANVCGAAPVAGVLAPSVDRVGRYFPLTLLWPTPTELSALEVAVRFQRGFERAERLVLDTLALERIEFTDFDRGVMDLAGSFDYRPVEGELRLTRDSAVTLATGAGRPRCIPLRAVDALEAPAVQLLGCQLEATPGCLGLWWTDGSAAVAPSWLITRGLPESSQYSAMLDGAWTRSGWDLGVAEPDTPFDPADTLVRAEAPVAAISTVSAALTDRGPVRPTNQDAFIERAELKLWAIADGMGGLSDGELASRMVCDSLADAKAAATLDEQVELALGQLQFVNDHLRRAATRPVNPVQSGSTVVVLIIRGRESAVIWAGDSRAYRLRDGLISQLTTDHSWAVEEGVASETGSQAITRAIGAEDELVPDIIRSEIQVNDRFLLCSDGVGRVLDDAALGSILQTEDRAACCAELIRRAFDGGGSDNATVIVVDCGSIPHDA